MRSLLVFLLLTSCCFCETRGNAIDVGLGFSNSTGWFYFPSPSLSFYWLRDTRYHELSGEFWFDTANINNGHNKVWNLGTGLSYSLLFKLGITNLYLGPTVGLYGYVHHIDSVSQHLLVYSNPSNESGLYFLGFKLAYVFGKKFIRFKIQDRFLMGIKSAYDPFSNSRFGCLNTISASLMFVFGKKHNQGDKSVPAKENTQ